MATTEALDNHRTSLRDTEHLQQLRESTDKHRELPALQAWLGNNLARSGGKYLLFFCSYSFHTTPGRNNKCTTFEFNNEKCVQKLKPAVVLEKTHLIRLKQKLKYQNFTPNSIYVSKY